MPLSQKPIGKEYQREVLSLMRRCVADVARLRADRTASCDDARDFLHALRINTAELPSSILAENVFRESDGWIHDGLWIAAPRRSAPGFGNEGRPADKCGNGSRRRGLRLVKLYRLRSPEELRAGKRGAKCA